MKERLDQLDGLRAIAALSVLAFHFTTRYDQVLVHAAPPAFEVPWGGYGVHLFFVISGFVILMTIERGAGPAAFVRSRFARLFPTYWVAVLGTWLLLRFAALPGHQRSVPELLANLTMVHGYFGIASVDGVYWSLGVELLFYLWMLLLACTGALRRPMTVIASAAALCIAAGTAARLAETAVPWTADTLLLLKWAPWFGLGMLAYLGSQGRDGGWPAGLATGALCVAAIAVRGPPADVAVALASAALVRLAAQRRLPVLGARPLVAIGVASYPLYLVHEKIGWLTMLGLQERGLDPTLSIAVATLAAIAVAWALHRAVERPTQAWLRGRPGRTIGSAPRAVQPRAGWAIGLLAILAVLGVGGRWSITAMRSEPPVREPVAAVDP
ncbi:MAG: acyltransferase family protein, partial [Burkholderiaceae bacterium]